jgi:hypothetical protein
MGATGIYQLERYIGNLEPLVLSSVAVQVAHVHDEGMMAPVLCTPPKLFHIYWAV